MKKWYFLSIYVLSVLGMLFLTGCTAGKGSRGSLTELQSLMTGSFDSRAQANSDSSYYEIALHMYPIWTDRPGKWLYVEQSLYSNQDQPYRQRIYGLEKGKRGTFISRVYELPKPDYFIKAYASREKFTELTQDQLIERQGCAVYLKRDKDGTYRGSTNKKDCQSSLRGASYATSRVSISSAFVQSWDQGFNVQDEQVWGATEGGYLFLKERKRKK